MYFIISRLYLKARHYFRAAASPDSVKRAEVATLTAQPAPVSVQTAITVARGNIYTQSLQFKIKEICFKIVNKR